MFGMLSVLAELQRELIVANTRDGLAVARVRGRWGGRPSKLDDDQIALAQQLYDAGGEDGRADRGDVECSPHYCPLVSQCKPTDGLIHGMFDVDNSPELMVIKRSQN